MFKRSLTSTAAVCTAILVLLVLTAAPEVSAEPSCGKYFDGCEAGLTCCEGYVCKFSEMYGRYCHNAEPEPEPEPEPKPVQPTCKNRGQFCNKGECCRGLVCSKWKGNRNTPFKCRPPQFAGIRISV